MKHLLLTLLLLVSLTFSYAQNLLESSTPKKPEWLSEPPKGESFIYYTGIGSSFESLEGAHKSAMSNILTQLTFENNTTIQVSSTFKKEENTKMQFNGKEDITFHENFIQVIKADGEKITITGLKKEEEYWQKTRVNSGIEYQYWILMKVPKKGCAGREVKQGYGVSAVLRSAVVPGWGQLYKKEKAKGIIILAGTGSLVLGSVLAENQRSSYYTAAQQTTDIRIRKDNLASADSWENVRNGLMVGAACAYIYNIVDAFTSRGAKKYAYIQDRKFDFYTFYLNKEFRAGLTCKF